MGESELEAKRGVAARECWGDEMAEVRGGGAWVEERGAEVERGQERLTGPDRAGEILREALLGGVVCLEGGAGVEVVPDGCDEVGEGTIVHVGGFDGDVAQRGCP